MSNRILAASDLLVEYDYIIYKKNVLHEFMLNVYTQKLSNGFSPTNEGLLTEDKCHDVLCKIYTL